MTADTAIISWNPEWELGIEIVDTKHKQLVRMVAALQEQVRNQTASAAVDSRLIEELLAYALTHFTEEESLFRGKGWDGEAAHILEHQNFLLKARREMIRFQAGNPETREALLGWLVEWLKHHIGFADREHGAFLRNRGFLASK
ncbi:MAG TPA: bacteriohemerythrin [Fibrobacteria bacterium]|nr:bacteriohemerythrin [Fibrobacteria bacterium]HOX52966.1 bacteriohemerythrin [Fibrobacteria bacterium]